MELLIWILAVMLVVAFAGYIISLLPLEPVPKRLAQAALGLVALLFLLQRLHVFGWGACGHLGHP